MKLSEAMRLGAMLGPQVFGRAWSGDGSCALGAAVRAANCPIVPDHGIVVNAARTGDTGAVARVPDEWIVVLQATHQCPACETALKGYQLIAHVNDEHRWTREAIADWVGVLEDAAVGRDRRCEVSESVGSDVVEIA